MDVMEIIPLNFVPNDPMTISDFNNIISLLPIENDNENATWHATIKAIQQMQRLTSSAAKVFLGYHVIKSESNSFGEQGKCVIKF
jgi:hypothetical protein